MPNIIKNKGCAMNQETEEALKEFFSAQKKLNQLGIIHSFDYLGDCARYLCQVMYGLELPKQARRALQAQHDGYDGMIGTSKVQVRYNNCPDGVPVRLVEPFGFDELIVVLAPNCYLRPKEFQNEFVFYRFTKEEALKKFKKPGGKYIGGRTLFSKGYDKVLSLT